MKVQIKGHVPFKGSTVAEVIEVLRSFPQDATVLWHSFEPDGISVGWEEER